MNIYLYIIQKSNTILYVHGLNWQSNNFGMNIKKLRFPTVSIIYKHPLTPQNNLYLYLFRQKSFFN